ncbi:hypothetical protein B7494_g545 [Chlorociboria aeruginascens]|nr:hypothetical protein B7494_g545 [Chlorociboria aeruginascens]
MLLETTNGFHAEKRPGSDSEPALVKEPLQHTGALDKFEQFDKTTCIGTEFRNVDLVDWITGPDSDELLRELAITKEVAERGVVFFRKQDGMTKELQKTLAQRIGAMGGKPETSGLYKHPLHHLLQDDPEIGSLDAKRVKSVYNRGVDGEARQSGLEEWHSDATYEKAAADVTILRLTDLPHIALAIDTNAKDTLWASGYEVYDRLSPPYQKFFDSLTATFAQPKLNEAAEKFQTHIFEGPRGSPENVGTVLSNVHPVVRTHPITGWKAVFAAGVHCSHINGVTKSESEDLQAKILSLIANNPDLQVRHHWENPNDMAIWDNRCVWHAAIHDHGGQGLRKGIRCLGVAEVPYLDPASKSRKQALAEKMA